MRSPRLFQTVALCTVLAGAIGTPAAADAPQERADRESPVFQDFLKNVQQYLKMRKSLPEERTTKHRKEIVDRRQALADAIRNARSGAKQGDVFTPEISQQFLLVIRGALRGPHAANIRKTIRPEAPVGNLHLDVNSAYPEHLPMTTVAPTLLRRLPQLPERLAYRIVGHDFILQDTEARLVIDLIPGAFP